MTSEKYSMSTIISHKVYIPQILILLNEKREACQLLFGNPTKSLAKPDCLVVRVVIFLQSFTDEATLTRTLAVQIKSRDYTVVSRNFSPR